MDNKVSSIIKRSLKIVKDYAAALLIFIVICTFVLELQSASAVMPWVSVLIFLLMFLMIYSDMRNTAFKEKRPQYNINPPSYKGLLYGAISIVPILAVQTVLLIVSAPQGYETMKWRIFQMVAGPVYWFARILGSGWVCYMAALMLVIGIAFLGYFAGHHQFYITQWLRQKTGVKKPKKG